MQEVRPFNMNKYSAFLFDMDGTLLDSEKLKGKALSETCSMFGGIADVNVYKDVMGETWSNVANHFLRKANINPNIDEFNAKFRIRYQKLLSEQLVTNKNVVPLLQQIKKSSKKCGLVSSAFEWMVNHAIAQLSLSEYFDIIICKEHVTHHKPHPEAYLKAIGELNLKSQDILIFEDSNAGLMAAENANCDSIAFRHSFNINNDFRTALKIITDFKVICDDLSS